MSGPGPTSNVPAKTTPAAPSGEGRDAVAPAGAPPVAESVTVPTPAVGTDAVTPAASAEGQVAQQVEAQTAGAPVVEAKPVDPEEQRRMERRQELEGAWEATYLRTKKEEGITEDVAKAAFADSVQKLHAPETTPEEIIAIQETLHIFDPHMREYLEGDPRAGMVAREKTKRVLVSVQEWIDQSAEQATQRLEAALAQDDTQDKEEARAALAEHLREFREQAEEKLIEPRRNLFSGDAGERMTAAVALARVKMADSTVAEMSLQEYFSQHFGYIDSKHFFEDVEKLLPLQEELHAAQAGEGEAVEPAPTGDQGENEVADEPEHPEAGPVVTTEDDALLAALEEGRRIASDPTATQEQRTAAAEKLTGELAAKHKRDSADRKRKLVTRTKTTLMWSGGILAAGIIPVLMMLALNSIGGK